MHSAWKQNAFQAARNWMNPLKWRGSGWKWNRIICLKHVMSGAVQNQDRVIPLDNNRGIPTYQLDVCIYQPAVCKDWAIFCRPDLLVMGRKWIFLEPRWELGLGWNFQKWIWFFCESNCKVWAQLCMWRIQFLEIISHNYDRFYKSVEVPF